MHGSETLSLLKTLKGLCYGDDQLELCEEDVQVSDELEKANELNLFYARFDCDANTCIRECSSLLDALTCDTTDRIVTEPSSVAKLVGRMACGISYHASLLTLCGRADPRMVSVISASY